MNQLYSNKIKIFLKISKVKKKKLCPSLRAEVQEEIPLLSRGSVFLFYSGLHKMMSTNIGKDNHFTLSTNSNVNLFQNTFTDTPRIMSDQMSGHAGGLLKLRQINHHKSTPCQHGTHTYLLKTILNHQ